MCSHPDPQSTYGENEIGTPKRVLKLGASFAVGDTVRFLHTLNKQEGIVTAADLTYPEAGSLNSHYFEYSYWVRLPNGMLIKDVLVNEIQLVETLSPKKK